MVMNAGLVTPVSKIFLLFYLKKKVKLPVLFSRVLKKNHAVIIVKEFIAVADCKIERSEIPAPIKYDWVRSFLLLSK